VADDSQPLFLLGTRKSNLLPPGATVHRFSSIRSVVFRVVEVASPRPIRILSARPSLRTAIEDGW